ncbi:MAG: response regulator transcription factor [Campylobacterales bacterium]|nr:response regulator transcription factor [Campylobacterales bacterium]
MKLLYLEDDVTLSSTISEFLSDEGFDVVNVYNGQKALDALYDTSFDLLILDVKVPKMDGFALLKALREANITTPAIFTTSLNSMSDLAKGYTLGADDYLKKPFELEELLFRIKALLKREYQLDNNTIQIEATITYNINTKELVNGVQSYTLNPKEDKLLRLLLQYRGSCVAFDMIFEQVWSFSEEHSHESLRTYIKKLRQYVGKERIESIKKEGYRFV